jgi:diguanylate cyclase (GGDEF)-like protein/PAS domain S-box-containing protein
VSEATRIPEPTLRRRNGRGRRRAEKERDQADVQLEGHVRRLAAVAELGRRALRTDELNAVAREALALALQTLGADLCELLETVPSGDALRLRVGLGFRAGLVGRAIVAGHERALAGFVLRGGEPVIIEDLASETRFVPTALLRDHGATSGIAVPIGTRAGPFGVLGVYTLTPRRFGDDDARFLQALAQLLGLAVDHERARAELRAREHRFRALIERSTDAILLMNPAGTILYAGPSIRDVLGYGLEEFEGKRVLSFVHPDDVHGVKRILADLLRAPGTSLATECRVRHADGSWRWAEGVTTNLLHEPAVRAIVGNYRDITERKRAEERIHHQSTHDALTGLPNRTLLMDRLGQSIAHATRSHGGLAVVYIDVDRFKRVNDALGHAAGDRLLQIIGERLRACVRDADTVARMGGDEFVVALDEVGRAEDVAAVANKILEVVALPVDIGGHRLHVTVSLGVSLYPGDGLDAETLLKNADHSLYLAKDRGRNTYQLCTPELNRRSMERLQLEKALRRAIERRELEIHYQPEFEARSGSLIGVEALVRWRHPEAGLLLPEQFITLAEDTRLILPIGEWVLRTATSQVREWRAAGFPGLRLAVNLSGLQFQQHDLPQTLRRALEEAGSEPGGVEVEITESVAMRDTEAARALMKELRGLGVRIAIDDFGTGYSSLAALQRFPIQTLKIDQSFVAGIGANGASALITAIITMAHSLELNVVAEGVETASQLAFLKSRDCDAVQGFYLGPPVPPEDFARLLTLAG